MKRRGLRARGAKAKSLLAYFEDLALTAGLSTDGVSVLIGGKRQFPECQYDLIRLPDFEDEPELYAHNFVHELQHARDNLDGPGMELTREEMEKRARAAEVRVSHEQRAEILRRHFK